eukprot:Gb_25262 [translate_table: standard]
MSKEVVERMHMELSQAHDKIMVSSYMGMEIQGSLKDLYKSFVEVEKAKTKGIEFHHKIQISLNQIEEWETKLTTVGSITHRNLLPNVLLLSLDEVTCHYTSQLKSLIGGLGT